MGNAAFWMDPDWLGNDNMRDGAEPFWMRKPNNPNICKKHGEFKSHAMYYGNYMDAGLVCKSCYHEGSPFQQALIFR